MSTYEMLITSILIGIISKYFEISLAFALIEYIPTNTTATDKDSLGSPVTFKNVKGPRDHDT